MSSPFLRGFLSTLFHIRKLQIYLDCWVFFLTERWCPEELYMEIHIREATSNLHQAPCWLLFPTQPLGLAAPAFLPAAPHFATWPCRGNVRNCKGAAQAGQGACCPKVAQVRGEKDKGLLQTKHVTDLHICSTARNVSQTR